MHTINENKKKLLYISTSIKSHIQPTFYLSSLLKKDYNIYYAVTNTILSELVKKNGFNSIQIENIKLGVTTEKEYLKLNNRNCSLLSQVKTLFRNEIYLKRSEILDEIIEKIKPQIVIIDIFSSNDYLLLAKYSSKIKIIFYNPMLSLYKYKNNLTIMEHNFLDKKSNIFLLSIIGKRTNIFQYLLGTLNSYQFTKQLKLSNISPVNYPKKTLFTKIYRNIPELILAPAELEVSQQEKEDNQYYIGLCVNDERSEIFVDPLFTERWKSIVNNLKTSTRLIYCSFGTFHENSMNKLIYKFLIKLLEALSQLKNITLICSVNKFVISAVKSSHVLQTNIHFFEYVPQLSVLSRADLFISHGGLGSIKEGINNKVPMLIYPLDVRYDQEENASYIQYHKLGIRGNIINDSTLTIKNNIMKILDSILFKENVFLLKKRCEEEYTDAKILEIINLLTK